MLAGDEVHLGVGGRRRKHAALGPVRLPLSLPAFRYSAVSISEFRILMNQAAVTITAGAFTDLLLLPLAPV